MDIKTVSHDKTVFVIGAPRSGTTWLGKIFDSNPNVLYRHEPDTLIPNDHIPRVVKDEVLGELAEDAEAYLDAMIGGRFLKSSGTLPIFRKTFRSLPMHLLYSAVTMGLRIMRLVGGNAVGCWGRGGSDGMATPG